jgi:hypothetical protein
MFDVNFPEIKTFYEEIEDIAKSWARQQNCSYQEATQVILNFAEQICKTAYLEENPLDNKEEK